MTDHELLRQYANNHSEDAFAELVRRHIDWVYSVSRRQVRDPALAEDVTQAVFLTLAKKAQAKSLSGSVSLSGWLFTTARYASATALKIERRRRLHERQAATMKLETATSDSETVWPQIEPILNDALAHLSAADREAVILRFFRGMTHQAIGASLQISEEAAQKRVTRAITRLRKKLGPAATLLSAAAVATLLSERATSAAPPQLASQSLSALKTGLAERPELILKGMSAMKTALAVKITAGAIAAALLGTATAFAINAAHRAPVNPITPIIAASAPAAPSLPHYDLTAVQTFRINFSQNGSTYSSWYARQQGVLQQHGGHGWSAIQLTIGPTQWAYRDAGPLILRKKPALDSGAMTREIESNLTSLERAVATREPATDATVDNTLCQAYRLQDGPGQSKNTVVYINPTTLRPARMTSDKPLLDMTIIYDPPIPGNLFKLPSAPNVQIVNARDYFEKKYPLDGALFTKDDIGQTFAVHEATQDSNGCFHIICSCRIADQFRPAVADLPDDENLNKFMMDDHAEFPFHYLRIAEFHESGIRVMYVIAVPQKILAVENICQLPVTMASPASILKIAHAAPPKGNNGGRDVHFPVDLEVKPQPNAPTARMFTARAYDEVMPIAGAVPETYFIGPPPRADGGTSTKEECMAEMEKQLATYLKENETTP